MLKMRTNTGFAALAVSTALVAGLLAGCGDDDDRLAGPPPLATDHIAQYKISDAQAARDLHRVRRATARYLEETNAIADGYLPTPFPPEGPACADPDGPGTAGIHYVHPELLYAPGVEIERPEIIVYEALEGGGRRLIGVTYKEFLRFQPARPKLFGEPFTGPTQPHGPGDDVHWDLHVWLWSHNPLGLYEINHTGIDCPKGFPRNRP